ncbi:MAG: hypothetical protein IAE85_07170 [Anaerolinea sp.]|nr:hypothetical protein [Anaerolinea sp.]
MTTQPTPLFTLRLWQAAQTDDPAALEWRGKVQALPDGEAYYFRGWPGLIGRLEALLAARNAETTESVHSEGGKV